MSILAGAAIAGGASLLGSALGFSSNKASNKANMELAAQQNDYNVALQDRQFQYNTEAATTEYERNLEQWNRENEYNSPSAQMQRYVDAGLNPNLIYGSGSSSSNSASSPEFTAARYQSPRAERATVSPNFRSDIDPYQAVSIGNQLAIQRAQADNIEAQADYTKTQADILKIDLPWRDIHNGQTWRLNVGRENKIDAETDYIKDNRKFLNARSQLLPHQEQLLKQTLKNMRTQNDIDTLNYDLAKIGVNNSDDLWQRIAARIFLNFKSSADRNSFINKLFD